MASHDMEQILARAGRAFERGDLNGAEGLYRDVLQQMPDHPGALYRLGIIAARRGDARKGRELILKALEFEPGNAPAHAGLAWVLLTLGRPKQALDSAERALAIAPALAAAHNHRGNALKRLGRAQESLAAFERAIKARPRYAEAHNNRGDALAALGRSEAAEVSYRRALTIAPKFARAMNNLANVLVKDGRFDEAESLFLRALDIRPGYADARYNLGVLRARQGRDEEAKDAYREVLARNPGFTRAEYNLGLLELADGNFGPGFAGYEARFKIPELGIEIPRFQKPRWDGAPLNGRRIVLYAEQGFGDAFQFVRFARMVARYYGGRVILHCRPKEKAVLETVPDLEVVVAVGEEVPDFDSHAPLMSLPHILGITADSVPWDGPYITARDLPRPRELEDGAGLKVGILWAGNPNYKIDETRSAGLSLFAPLLSVPGTRFYSLQYGPRAADLGKVPFGDSVEDLSPWLDGFAETAAMVDQLDLVITVDTYLVHLAGAMGKPTWLLLAHQPDWRWMKEGEATPWYPDVRLLRQPAPGDWESVIAAAADDLAGWAQPQ